MYLMTEPEIHLVDNGDMDSALHAAMRAEQRPTSKFPTTITEKGEVIAPDLVKALRKTLGGVHGNVTFADGEEGGGEDTNFNNYGLSNTGFAETLQLQSTSGPPSPTDRSVYSSRTSRSAGAGAAGDTMSRHSASRASMESGLGRHQSAGSVHSGVSGTSGGSGGGNHQLFGATYILMVRIKGSVLSPQTIDRLFARSNAYQPLLLEEVKVHPEQEEVKHRNVFGVINPNHEYLQWCREDAREFLPPVGKKYHDDNVK